MLVTINIYTVSGLMFKNLLGQNVDNNFDDDLQRKKKERKIVILEVRVTLLDKRGKAIQLLTSFEDFRRKRVIMKGTIKERLNGVNRRP